MIRFAILLFCASAATPGHANAWEKHFDSWVDQGEYVPSDDKPEILSNGETVEADLQAMYRRGFIPIGVTQFESRNSKTRDGVKLGEKLAASHILIITSLESSRTGAIPWVSPTTSTTQTTGQATVFGSGGSATGNYSGTSTTTGSQTNMLPFTVNTYSKAAIYFAEEPKIGPGIYSRNLTDAEIQRLETRRALAVRFVRDYSPAYYADILPGDIILTINGKPIDPPTWWGEILDGQPDELEIDRGGKPRKIVLTMPPEWLPQKDTQN